MTLAARQMAQIAAYELRERAWVIDMHAKLLDPGDERTEHELIASKLMLQAREIEDLAGVPQVRL